MAVRIDVQAFRDSVPPAVGGAAARLSGGVGELESVGGGVQAVVRDRDAAFQPWVGVVDGAFTGDCDCSPAGGDLCPHAVAVALTAFDAGATFAGAATPPGAGPFGPDRTEFERAVRRLAPRQLTDLVVEYAVSDRLFATRLLGVAGLLDPADESGLADLRAVIRDASNATTGDRWEISDLEIAGHRLAAEVEILCVRPATPAMLDLVEDAIGVWNGLSGHLIDAHDVRRTDPEEISEPLVAAHRDLCERLELDPVEVADRLAGLVERCDCFAIDVAPYEGLLGDHAGTIVDR